MNGTPRPDRQLPVEHDVVADSTVTYHQSVSDTNSEKGRRPAQRVAPHVGHNGPQPGSIGRYRILKSLGRGGFGDVYLAHDPKLDRQVALKVNRNRQAPSPDSAAALLQEARLAAKVTHERIVTIYDVGECDEAGVYVAMEFVPGKTLASYLAQGPLPQDKVIQLAAEIAEGIHHAHRQGLVHRDLKPANILIDESGHVKIADFGLALHAESQYESKGEVSGTVRYMSPEQFEGKAHHLDGRSDIWSLGVILYECLTGVTPFRARDLDGFREELLNRPLRPMRQVDDAIDERLDDICQRCLAKSPEDRYATARDVKTALQSVLRSSRRRSSMTVFGACLLLVLLGGTALLVNGNLSRRQDVGDVDSGTAQTGKVAAQEDGGGVTNLLDAEPAPFLFDSTDSFNSAQYDPDARRFTVHSDGMSLFAFSDDRQSTGRVTLTCELKDGSGEAGLLWGLHDDLTGATPDVQKCLVARFSVKSSSQTVDFKLQELTLSGSSHEVRRIPMTYSLAYGSLPLPSPRELESVDTLTVTLVDGQPVTFTVFGQSCELTEAAGKVDWKSFAHGRFGLTTGSGSVAVSKLLLDSTEETASDGS